MQNDNKFTVKTGTIEELTKDEVLPLEEQKKIHELDKILKAKPNHVPTLMEKGFILFENQVDGKAIEIFKQVIDIAPKYVDAYVWLIELFLFHWANIERAEPLLVKALQVDRNRADVHKLYADLCAEKHDKFRQLYHLKRAIELESSWLSPRISLIELLLNQRKYKLAEKQLEEAYKHIQSTFPIPDNPMQQYYELLITGRTSYTKKDLDEYKKRIEKNLS
jgi:tetratricopeptide (TPR) repeat protein